MVFKIKRAIVNVLTSEKYYYYLTQKKMNELNPTLSAALLAFIAMLSLVIGAWIGVTFSPSKKINATILAFGTGALIQALSLELAHEGAQRLLHEGNLGTSASWLVVAFGFLAGGIIYNKCNSVIAARGGALRHQATTEKYLIEQKKIKAKAKLNILSKVEIIRALPAEEMHLIIDVVQSEERAKGETIFKKGENGNALYLIIDGEVEINLKTESNRNKKIATLKHGDSFGEIALLSGEKRTANAVTTKKSTLWRIDREDFLRLLKEAPALNSALEKLNAERTAENITKITTQTEKKEWVQVALQSISRVTEKEKSETINEHHQKTETPIAIFLGAVLDGIPESIVIGASFISFATFNPNFLIAVFLSNFPEAMSSAMTMKRAKFSTKKIFSLWGGLVIIGSISAALGQMFFSSANPIVLTLIEAIAGGGILAMITSVMIPEAFEEGGPVIGIATICGFLSALFFSIL